MAWLHRLLNTLRPGNLQRDIDREIAFHIKERAEQLRNEGATEQEAQRLARLHFGNPAVQRERTRDVDIAGAFETSIRNVRHAARAMRRAPGFAASVVITLALGIGGNTAVFSALDAVLLRPLPYPDADRLVVLTQSRPGSNQPRISPARIEDWNSLNTTFEGITAYYTDEATLTVRETPEQFSRAYVAPRFMEVLGVAPARGRRFQPSEHRFGEPITTIIISDRFWRTYRGADPRVVEQPPVRAGFGSVATVGVMAPEFQFPARDIEFWTASTDAPWTKPRALSWYTGIGRLRPGVTVGQAEADLNRVQRQLGQQYPDTDRDISVRVTPLKETMVGASRASLWLIFGAVSLLLLIACTNIAALLLSRATRREHEIAVRYSLGGSRTSVALQLLTEVGVLAFVGAALGLGVAVLGVSTLRRILPALPRVNEIAVDERILLYTLASTVVVSVLCGLVPALRSTRTAGSMAPSRTQVSSRHSLQWLLVGTQVALSVMLLAGAGLLVRSIDALSRVAHGFDPTNVLTLRVSGQYGTETTDEAVHRINAVLDGLEALPGVDAAAITSTLPGVRSEQQLEFVLAEGRDRSASRMVAEGRIVSPGYFAAMRIPVESGELCTRPPDAGGRTALTHEVMVNRRFADLYLQGTSVIDLHLMGGLDRIVENRHLASVAPARIAGIVGDARELGAHVEPIPTVYSCFSAPNPSPWHLVRTREDPRAIVSLVRERIRELQPRRAVFEIAPLTDRLEQMQAPTRLRTWVLSVFALSALALVCAGIYGTLSYAVTLRLREVALRLALGAFRHTVVQQLIGTSLRTVTIAALVGLGLSLLFTRSLSTMLYGVTPTDPVTLSGVIVLVLIVAFVAAVIPATRAAFVQPMRALREE